jgi:hypothetical protein
LPGVRVSSCLCRSHNFFRQGNQSPGLSDNQVSNWSYSDRAVRAFEQGHAKGILQFADLAAKGRLTYVALVRSSAEMPFIRNSDDIFQVSYVHQALIQMAL